MLGLIFIYFVGKYYYDLADKYDRPRWGFAIAGVATYYGGMFIFAFLLGIIIGTVNPGFLDNTSEAALGIMSIPLGIISTVVLYQILKRSWAKQEPVFDDTALQEIGETEV
ncbi:hypothetical protein GYB22_01330 [bacterium]|nr:hypothetical protein [bacterium]